MLRARPWPLPPAAAGRRASCPPRAPGRAFVLLAGVAGGMGRMTIGRRQFAGLPASAILTASRAASPPRQLTLIGPPPAATAPSYAPVASGVSQTPQGPRV